MKKSQIQLTDMNKKLIDRHNQEVTDLNNKLKTARTELYDKRNKLEKYKSIVADCQE